MVRVEAPEQFRQELLGLIARHGAENDLKLYEMLGILWHVMFQMSLEIEDQEEGKS
jgi:hypothetical protein